jgi:AcrR family transcriptional regulator
MTMPERAAGGRQNEARRNDAAILASARAVFVADPDAPVAAVAEHAGVNISSLYRRFASKEDLLRKLCSDGLQTYVDVAQEAVANEAGDPWDVFVTFMERIVETDTHALTVKLAGRFEPAKDDIQNAIEADAFNQQLVARTQKAGALREDVTADDLAFIFEQLTGVKAATPERTAELRARYLVLQLDGLRAPGRTQLPGTPPTAGEQHARWEPPPGKKPPPKRRRTIG